MPNRTPVKGMPGFLWIYPGDPDMHGFRARHSFNPDTGASLSLRSTQAVQRGEMRLDQALIYAAHPRKVDIVNFQGRRYRITTFNTIYGASRYASTRTGQTHMHMTALGQTRKKYPLPGGREEPDTYYRTISDHFDYSVTPKRISEEAYTRFDQTMKGAAKTPSYYLWEEI